MKSILRASAYHMTVGFVEPPVQGLLFCFGLSPFSRLLRHAWDTAGDSIPEPAGGYSNTEIPHLNILLITVVDMCVLTINLCKQLEHCHLQTES